MKGKRTKSRLSIRKFTNIDSVLYPNPFLFNHFNQNPIFIQDPIFIQNLVFCPNSANPVFSPEPRIQSKPRIRPKSRIQSKPFCSNQKSTKEIGNVFERRIEKLLNKHEIKAHIFPCRRGDDGIDIIATFNRRIILIQCKNVAKSLDVNILKNFQASVGRFGKAVLSVVVYNGKKLKNNPLTTNAEIWWKGSCSNICIETEKTIVDCIKNKISQKKFKQTEESEELEKSKMELEESSELESGLDNELDDELSESESEQYFEETFSVKQTSYKNGQDIKRHIENLLNQNGIQANLFPQRRGDNGIDIIATFNRKIILIKCINVSGPIRDNILRDFQASVYRFGEGILNVIVYNNEELNNSLIKNEGSSLEIVNEKMIVQYIKNKLSKKHSKITSQTTIDYDEILYKDILNNKFFKNDNQVGQGVSHNDTPVMVQQEVMRAPELYSGNSSSVIIPNDNDKINSESWNCPICTFRNSSLMSQCEVCLNKRPDARQQWSCPGCSFINECDVIMCVACDYVNDY